MAGTLANYAPTAYKSAVLQFNNGILDFENRKPEYYALAAAIRSSQYLYAQDEISAQVRSFGRAGSSAPTQIPIIKRMNISLVNGRICVLDGQEPTTDMVSITFTPKGFRIKIPTLMLEQNYIRAVDLLARGVTDGWHAWYAYANGLTKTFLEANKSTALVDVPPYFDKTNNAYVRESNIEFYAALNYALKANVMGSNFIDVASGNAEVSRLIIGTNGPNNAINQASLLYNTDRLYPDMSLMPDAGYSETHYLFPLGAFGIYFWLSPNAAANHVHIPDNDYWYSVKDPLFGYFDASVHYQAQCRDHDAGVAAGEPVYYDIYEFTIDTGFAGAYSSVSGESPIIKFNLSGRPGQA